MTWLKFKRRINETASRLTSEAVPITFLHGDRDEAQKVLSRLLQMGVEQIPVGSCDLNHFCFKHGCVGHTNDNTQEDNQ